MVSFVLPTQPLPIEAWTPLDPKWCAVVSGTDMLATDAYEMKHLQKNSPVAVF